jgi:hypothetical protein
MRRAWALAASVSVVACAGGHTAPRPDLAWWHSQSWAHGGDGVPRVLSPESVWVQAAALGVEPATASLYAHWTLLVAPMQAHGGVVWRVSPASDAVEVCLDHPAPGRPVTQALQAPVVLIGQITPKPVRNTGDCR